MNAVFGSWDQLFFETFDITNIHTYSFIFMEGSERGLNRLNVFLSHNLPSIETWVANGGRLFLNAFHYSGIVNFGFDGVTNRPSSIYGISYANSVLAPAHPIITGSHQPVQPGGTSSYYGNYFALSILIGPGISPILTDKNSQGRVVLAEKDVQDGLVVFGTMSITNFHLPQPHAHNLRRNILEYAAGISAAPSARRSVRELDIFNNDDGCWLNTTYFDPAATNCEFAD